MGGMDSHLPLGVDICHPSPARTYDYLLGGKDNYPVDREAAEAVIAVWPGMRDMGRAARAWAMRVVTYLAEQGVDQYLDIGSGLPTAENVHQVAQRINPAARVMYADNDPIVLAHGRALLAENDRTEYVEADVRDPKVILAGAAKLLDFSRPVALILSVVLHYVPEDPAELLAAYVQALAPGSFVAISHNTTQGMAPELREWVAGVFPSGWYPRTPDDILRIFQGLELVEPGLVTIEQWRPTAEPVPLQMPLLGGIARVG
jgi:SAM-dependent methyltransferase